MIARNLMDILPRKQFQVYFVNVTAKPANLPDVMIVALASNAPICVIHATDDELHRSTDECSIPTKCHKFNSDPTINAVQYKYLNAMTCKLIGTTPLNNQTRFWRPTGAMTLIYQTGILHVATNSILCSHSSKASGTNILGLLKRWSTESSSPRWITDEFTQLQATQGLRQENSKRWKNGVLVMDDVKPAQSERVSPIVLVRKKYGTLRFCINYRKVKAGTTWDPYQIPGVDDCIDSLGDSTLFSNLDANCGFWVV